jgi:DNA polymerase delta subunit 4
MRQQGKLNLKSTKSATSSRQTALDKGIKKKREKREKREKRNNDNKSTFLSDSKHSSIETTPIIDQITLDNYENQLRLFDLNLKYGPIIGISRLDRWNRAERFELSPPSQVRDILLDKNIQIKNKNECIWFGLV